MGAWVALAVSWGTPLPAVLCSTERWALGSAPQEMWGGRVHRDVSLALLQGMPRAPPSTPLEQLRVAGVPPQTGMGGR